MLNSIGAVEDTAMYTVGGVEDLSKDKEGGTG